MIEFYLNRECYNYFTDHGSKDINEQTGNVLKNYAVILRDNYIGFEYYFHPSNKSKFDAGASKNIDLIARIGKGIKFLEGDDFLIRLKGQGCDDFFEKLKTAFNETAFKTYAYSPELFCYDAIKFYFDCKKEFLKGMTIVKIKK